MNELGNGLMKPIKEEKNTLENSGKEGDYEMVDHPTHYNNYSREVIDMMVDIWGIEATIKWCEMTAFKYRMRMGTKPENPIEQDLKKEKWYLDKAKELEKTPAYEHR